MKKVEMYQCDYCNETYHTEKEALKCEGFGKQSQLAKKGQMIEYKVTVGGGFDPFYVDMRVGKVTDLGHMFHYEFEEFDQEDKEWYESTFDPSGIYGNEDFTKYCKVKNTIN